MFVFYWISAIFSLMLSYRMVKILFIETNKPFYIKGVLYSCLFFVPVLLSNALKAENVFMIVVIWSIAWPLSYLAEDISYKWHESKADDLTYYSFMAISALIVCSTTWMDILMYWLANSILVSFIQAIKRYDTYKRPFVTEFALNVITFIGAPVFYPLGCLKSRNG